MGKSGSYLPHCGVLVSATAFSFALLLIQSCVTAEDVRKADKPLPKAIKTRTKTGGLFLKPDSPLTEPDPPIPEADPPAVPDPLISFGPTPDDQYLIGLNLIPYANTPGRRLKRSRDVNTAEGAETGGRSPYVAGFTRPPPPPPAPLVDMRQIRRLIKLKRKLYGIKSPAELVAAIALRRRQKAEAEEQQEKNGDKKANQMLMSFFNKIYG